VIKPKRHFVTPAVGAPLLGYETLDAFYRDVREKLLPDHYYERRGRRLFVSVECDHDIPQDEPQNSKTPNQKELETLY